MATDKKKVLNIILSAAKNYDAYLKDRHFLLLFKSENRISQVEIGFRDSNFLHLTGVQSNLSAKKFYERCLNNRLSIKDFSLDKNGKTEQKLQVLPFLHTLPYNNCMIGEFVNSGILIQADYFVGDSKLILSLGFRHTGKIDIPVSLYKGDIRELTNPTNKVLAIFTRLFSEENYNNIAYLSKGISLSDIEIPDCVVIKAET